MGTRGNGSGFSIQKNQTVRQLVGSSESRVLELLGEPDKIGDGSEVLDQSGNFLYRTDKRLMYRSLLPKMRVFFEIRDGKVHTVGYIPMQKK